MKANFNFPLLGLDGKPITDGGDELNAGKFLAARLAQQTQGDAYKLFGWSVALHKGEDITLDKSDAKTLRDVINNDTGMTILAKAQLLEVIDADKN